MFPSSTSSLCKCTSLLYQFFTYTFSLHTPCFLPPTHLCISYAHCNTTTYHLSYSHFYLTCPKIHAFILPEHSSTILPHILTVPLHYLISTPFNIFTSHVHNSKSLLHLCTAPQHYITCAEFHASRSPVQRSASLPHMYTFPRHRCTVYLKLTCPHTSISFPLTTQFHISTTHNFTPLPHLCTGPHLQLTWGGGCWVSSVG